MRASERYNKTSVELENHSRRLESRISTKMGVRSEYQKHFKVSALRKSLPNYYENVAFRTARRDREYSHTPLSWYEEETASVASEDSSDGETDQEKKTPNGQSSPAAVKSDVDAAETIVNNNDKEPVLTETVVVEKPSVNKELITENEDSKSTSTHSCKGRNSATVLQAESSEKHCPEVMIKTKKSPTKVTEPRASLKKLGRPDRKQKIPRPRSSSRPSSRQETKVVHHPAPFVSYGWADVERDLCLHKTFNVKATTDVHPAAKRAHSRQKEAVRERRSASAKRTTGDRLKAILEAAAMEKQRQDLEWKSEYQQKFAAYDVTEYSRNLSARANDRKLNRIVYVP